MVRVQLAVPRGGTVRRAPTGARHHAYILATAPTAGGAARILDEAVTLLGQAGQSASGRRSVTPPRPRPYRAPWQP
ncbi:hypothetical protein J7I97_12720 [Streptomyces sp. ISL-87]|nr:hypothetical protein [Streptomyces sp. ISL-21]MBT2609120.1 hypothetical protein [Streptomyces sp. ISL-87]